MPMMMTRTVHLARFRFSAAAALLTIFALLAVPADGPAAQILPPLPGTLIVTITSPARGSTVSDTITVSASISSVGTLLVAGVQFKLDGANLGPEDTAAPYSIPWDTTTAGNGSHTLTAVARDTLGVSFTSDPVTVTVSNEPPPDTVRLEETAAALAPAGAWSGLTSASAGATLSGDGAVFAAAAGATASFSFNGTGVSWIGLPCELCGIANVYLDGTLAESVDTFAPSRPASSTVLFTASGLTAGSHTLVIEVTGAQDPASGGANAVVDAIDVEGGGGSGTPPPAPARSEESAAALEPASAWFGMTSADAGVSLSGDFAVASPEAGATASFTFTGSEVSWVGFKCERCGIARALLDGAVAATVDTYAPSRPAATEAMFTATGLAAGTHTLMIEVTGTGNADSAGTFITVDAFDVR